MTISAPGFPFVGIGASAGGVEALEGFFHGIPDDPGMAFVIVTHLSPDRESLLHEVIGRYTDLRCTSPPTICRSSLTTSMFCPPTPS